MPAGISWPRYISAVGGALLSMFAGSQAVHIMYQPLKDLHDKVEVEKDKLRNEYTATTSSSGSISQAATPVSNAS